MKAVGGKQKMSTERGRRQDWAGVTVMVRNKPSQVMKSVLFIYRTHLYI